MNMKVATMETAQVALGTLIDTASALTRRFDRALSARGISYAEYRLLQALAIAGPQGMTRIDLANTVGLTASAVTRALKPLQKLGLTTSARNERDARQSLAIISGAGIALLLDAQAMLQEVIVSLPIAQMPDQHIQMLLAQLESLKQSAVSYRNPVNPALTFL